MPNLLTKGRPGRTTAPPAATASMTISAAISKAISAANWARPETGFYGDFPSLQWFRYIGDPTEKDHQA
ncbi:hypothetical protein NBRC116598_26550 [Pseudophaeobacter arcticus]|uniref:Uncharacterized protein n=1 Tax=Pseudophaeobacter arcticus TaxID=385492 RepID=A0ABQ0AMW0_9RHOB